MALNVKCPRCGGSAIQADDGGIICACMAQPEQVRMGNLPGFTYPGNYPITGQVWIVGKMVGYQAWEFMGVFSTQVAAIEACIAPQHFVGPAVLNERLPEEQKEWPGCFYPLAVAAGEE